MLLKKKKEYGEVNNSSAFGSINTRRSPEGDVPDCILNKYQGR